MPIINRTKFVVTADSDVSASSTDVFLAPITPLNETWQITRIIMADKNIGDNMSGGFLVDYGAAGSREVITQAFLTGDTLDQAFQKTYTGDGVDRLRLIRENNSGSSKKMVIMVEAIKRL